jgi:hypothetical protein
MAGAIPTSLFEWRQAATGRGHVFFFEYRLRGPRPLGVIT